MAVTAQTSRWGASLAVRIPKPVAEQWGVREGAVIELVPRRDEVVLPKKRYDLGKLVAGIEADNRHGETDWGGPEGVEAW